MPLTANALPSIPPGMAVPIDAMLDLTGGAQTLAATGYMGSPNQIDWGQGREAGLLNLDITNLKVSAGDETYRFFLMGSNDVAWANGNIENLAMHDFSAAVAGRIVPTIMGASPAIPPVGAAGTIVHVPFLNLMQRIVYRYLRGYVVIGGTAPTTTFRAWLAPFEMKI